MSPNTGTRQPDGGAAPGAPGEGAPAPVPPRLIVLAAGKGGVGRSLLAANAAVHLAKEGHKVVLFDADLGNCNLHTLLGIEAPERTMDDFVHKRVDTLNALVAPTKIANLGLVSAARDPVSAASLKHGSRTRLFAHLAHLTADFVVVDTPVGTGLTTLDLFNQADCPIVVTAATPLATERMWRFLCAAFIRAALRVGPPAAARALLEEAFDAAPGRPAPTPGALCRAAKTIDTPCGDTLEQARARFRPTLVVNEARTKADTELGEAIRMLARDRLEIDLEVLGTLAHDEAAWISVSRRRPVVLEAPDAPVTEQIVGVAHRVLARLGGSERRLSEPATSGAGSGGAEADAR
jgi:flagellar biosynthesis protein FlhG